MANRVDKIMVTTNTQGICYCTTGKKTQKIQLKVKGGTIGVKYCQYCKTAYIRQDGYDPELFKRYKVLDNVEANEENIRLMMEKSKVLVRNRKDALREKRIELKRGEKLVQEKRMAEAKALEEHKKQHEGKVEIYSHDMDKHYTQPFVPKSPKEKRKRSFFS